MHLTALTNCKLFFDCYSPKDANPAQRRVIDIGSQDVNGSLRRVTPACCDYTGVDFAAGAGVDIVLTDPYELPFETASTDIVLSSSCFEHAEMFWLVFLEVLRILKPGGLFYLNVPSNGDFHRWPVDCWRFYPDSGRALVSWAKRNGIHAALLESYTSAQNGDQWNDFVAVFIKDETQAFRYPTRITDTKPDYNNGWVHLSQDILRESTLPEDRKRLLAISQVLNGQIRLT